MSSEVALVCRPEILNQSNNNEEDTLNTYPCSACGRHING